MTLKKLQRRFQKKWGKRINPVFQWFEKIPYCIRRFYNRKRIKSRDFTVISNNCWAGKLYQYLDMPYLSPTVGLYFFADDYLRFIKNLKYYMSLDLEFISVEESRYKDILIERHHDVVPLAKLDDVEIVFLHYKSKEEAEGKWNRRKQRINWDNMYYKFAKMNLCTEKHLLEFSELPYEQKFMLNNRKPLKYDCEYYWNGKGNEKEIILDTDPFPGILNLRKILNGE